MINLVVIDYYDSYPFFARLLNEERRVVVITNLISVFLRARKDGWEARLLSSFSTEGDLEIDYDLCREVVSKEISLDNARKYGGAIASCIINELDHDKGQVRILCWNGADIKGCAIRAIKKRYPHCISTTYFELSNFPGLYFADNEGVNAQSSAASQSWDFQLNEAERVAAVARIEKMSAIKKDFHPPQAKKSKNVSIRHVMDYLFSLTVGISNFSALSVAKRFIKKLTSTKTLWGVKVKDVELGSDVYLFPMQVSSDSQLLINYSGDVFSSLVEAKKVADDIGCKKLLVKMHPAENDKFVQSRLVRMCDELGVVIVNDDISNIMKYVDGVITVNSTVGFEAILSGKCVHFLGSTQYANIKNRDQLYKYVSKYLYEGDFFGKGPVCKRSLSL